MKNIRRKGHRSHGRLLAAMKTVAEGLEMNDLKLKLFEGLSDLASKRSVMVGRQHDPDEIAHQPRVSKLG